MKPVVFDTGVIVAALIINDPDHQACVEFIRSIPTHLRFIPETIIGEVANMVERWPRVEADFYESLERNAFRRISLENIDLARMAALVRQYADFPLGGNDASVVAIAERLEITEIATLDHRHFRAIRPTHADAFILHP